MFVVILWCLLTNRIRCIWMCITCILFFFLVKRQQNRHKIDTVLRKFWLQIQMKCEKRSTNFDMCISAESGLKTLHQFFFFFFGKGEQKNFGYFLIMYVMLLTNWLHNRCCISITYSLLPKSWWLPLALYF